MSCVFSSLSIIIGFSGTLNNVTRKATEMKTELIKRIQQTRNIKNETHYFPFFCNKSLFKLLCSARVFYFFYIIL